MEGRCAMKVLVAVGSKYGSTRGIAHVITDELKSLGFQVDLEDACDVPSVKAYDAVVIGSAIDPFREAVRSYGGRFLER